MGQQHSSSAQRRRRIKIPPAAFVTRCSPRVEDKYKIDAPLGRGHYGVVRRCTNIKTGERFAVKTIRKARVSRVESLRREVKILRTVDHPNIIKLVDVYEDDTNLHLVTELCTGGELFDRIIEKTESEEGRYSERDAARIVSSTLSAIAYCHDEHNICHRDLKPENFLFKSPDDDAELKIIDFGLSRFEKANVTMTTRVGTPYYIAPEVLGRNYNKACDLWSIGVITYILLCGYPPFYGRNDVEILASVRAARYDFPSPEWDTVSDEAKAFVRALLMVDPSKRPTAAEALKLPWIQLNTGPEDTQGAPIHLSHKLKNFTGMSHFKRKALNIIAKHLTEADIGHLRELFCRIDEDGNGSICIDELRTVVDNEGLGYIEEEVAEMMRGVDLDGNETIEWEEFLAATIDRHLFIREDNVRRAFDFFDIERTGSITVPNLVDIFGSEAHAREVLGNIDLNGDGKISYEEFRHMMESDPPGSGTDSSSPPRLRGA